MALARENSVVQIAAVKEKYPGRLLGWFASADITKPEAGALLTNAIKNGAIGFGTL